MTTTAPDRVRIHPGQLHGEVAVPGDKSLSHRALLLSAFADRPVRVGGLAPSGDVAATAAALTTMGAQVDLAPQADGSLAGSVRGPLGEARDVLDCGNSGTSLRLLAGVVAGIDGLTVLTGDASLRSRPVDRIAVPLRAMGARLDAAAGGHRPPLVVRGGHLTGTSYLSPVASAQIKSAILLAGLRADGPTTVTSPLPSRDHTERMLAHFGHPVQREVYRDGTEVVTVDPLGDRTLAADEVVVARDPSSAAFWLVAAACGAGTITATGVCANPLRLGVVAALRRLGVEVAVTDQGETAGEPLADLTVAPTALTGASLQGQLVVDALDELPVLALAGACSADGLEVHDAAELRVKESDRIAVLAAALRAVGLEVEERPDGYRVPGGQRPGPGTVEAHGDHRIAMTAAIAAVLGTGPVEIGGFGAVATSYPSFLDDLARLGGRAEVLA
ncbi:3-phosphoshikimate 1-carboxyvinyltransferase [Nitriliruptor alkaliphilus]|uniref:3-phosphoshikimate 1-carboxyvinyltransferase n=1 Tax=Nitriliruptor alkaliphilus TaxID=427918 RepID=UPI000697DE69|nr:3-phosphoshikimate 1-carboxyvinyltransferase [Nitriliruptor alkaliphilus]